MKDYKPTFTTEHRTSGQNETFIVPQFEMPDGSNWVAWSIPTKEYTPAVEEAIKHAFELGANAQRMVMVNVPTIHIS